VAATGRAFVLVESKKYAVGLEMSCPGGALLPDPAVPSVTRSSRTYAMKV
jgi:hypothetical protein